MEMDIPFVLIFKVNFINLNKPYAVYNIGKANTKSK